MRRAHAVELRLRSDNSVEIHTEAGSCTCGTRALTILDLFQEPRSMEEALDVLKDRLTGLLDWRDASSTIVQLYRAGVLLSTEHDVMEGTLGSGFSAAPLHARMLNDRVRTEAYLQAISDVVKPGMTVVEIGAGTGVLSVAAARAGAERVYAIEANSIARVAESLFLENNVHRRVKVIQGWSSRIDLPERADVLISEIIGDEPLGENVLEVVADAKRRFLKPGGKLIPAHLEILGQAVDVPKEILNQRGFTDANIERWNQWYNMKFDPLREYWNSSPTFVKRDSMEVARWPVLSPPVSLATVDFDDSPLDDSTAFEITTHFTVNHDGQLSGFVLFFDMTLDSERPTRLSVQPRGDYEANSWRTPILLFGRGRTVSQGESVKVTYRHGAGAGPRIEIE